MNKKLHVLWIPSWYHTDEDPLKGCFFREQAQALKEAGIDIGIVYPDMESLKKFSLSKMKRYRFQTTNAEEDGIPAFRLHGWNIFPKFPKAAAYLWAKAGADLGRKYIRSRSLPDVIHAHSALWAGLAARHLSQEYRLPYVVTEHRDVFLRPPIYQKDVANCWSTPLFHEIFDNASQTIAVSTALQKALQKTFTNNPLSSIQVLPNSTDINFFSPPGKPPPAEPFTYFTLAALIPEKNVELAVLSFAEVLKVDPKVKLRVGGDGPERGRLQQLAERLGISRSLQFLGRLSRKEARDAYRQVHAFVLPSNRETFGVVLIEALASGLPVIATRCGGPEDIVNEKVGLLVPPKDVSALAKAMLHVKNAHLQFDSRMIRSEAVKRFSSISIAEKLMGLYAGIS